MATNKRAYVATHPWLQFQVDLRQASYSLWMNLGAIQSKCEHVANVLLPPDVAEEMQLLYLAKGIRATTAIEGNTLSEEEVKERIRGRAALPPSKEYQGREIDNVVKACHEIAREMIDGEGGSHLTVDRIKHFNRLILDGLPVSDHVNPGELRKVEVGVGTYRGAPCEDCEYLLERLCEFLRDVKSLGEEHKVAFGVIRAVLAHLYLAWIHPFGDGNGRTARLIEVQILLGAGIPTIAAHLLSNFYNQTRNRYYQQLAQASKSGGNVIPFLEYAVQGLVDQLDLQINRIRRHQRDLAWKDYVYERFKNEPGAPAHRQRQIALDLARHTKHGAPISSLSMLTPQLAAAYARKTPRTLTRDLNELQQRELIVRSGKTVRANMEALQVFLPRRRPERQRE